MFKVNLDQQLTDIHGEKYTTKKMVEGKQKELKMTLREALLTYLGSNLPLQNTKETTWVWSLGVEFNKNVKELEISDDKIEFLRRIIADNKVTTYNSTGAAQQVSLYPPFLVGQLLQYLGTKED